MADTSLNILSLAALSFTGAPAGDGSSNNGASPDVALGGDASGVTTNSSFDTMFSQMQQANTQLSAQQQNTSQPSAAPQPAASSQPNSNTQQQDNTQQASQSPPQQTQQPTGNSQQQAPQAGQNGQGRQSGTPGNKKTASTTPDASNATAAVAAPVTSNTPVTAAQGSAPAGSIGSALQSLLDSLIQEWEAQGQASQGGQAQQGAQTTTPSQDNFLQMLQAAVNAGGSPDGNNAELAAALENFVQADGQTLSASDLQQINALVAQLTAAPDAALANTLTQDIAGTSTQDGQGASAPNAQQAATPVTQPDAIPAATLSTSLPQDAADTSSQNGQAGTTNTPATQTAPQVVTYTPLLQNAAAAPVQRPANDAAASTQNTITTPAVNSNTTPAAITTTAAVSTLVSLDNSGTGTGGQGGNNTGQDSQPGHNATPVTGLLNVQPVGVPVAANTGTFAQSMNQVQQAPQSPQGSPAEQLVAAVRSAVTQSGTQVMSVQMHPAELGWLSVRLEVTPEGHATMNVTADNPNTLKLLSGDVNKLTEMLTKVGISTDAGSLSFNLRGDGQPSQQGQSQGQAYSTYASQPSIADEALAAVVPQIYTVAPSDGVNIVT